MELGMLRASLICLLIVIVTGAEEPIDPSHIEEQLTVQKLEDTDNGPLMKALLVPGENSSSESPELQRDKRHKKWYGQRATWKKKGGGGGCYGGCGGGGYQIPTKVIVIPIIQKGKRGGGGGGGCGYGGCGGGYHKQPSGYCNTCGGGGGGGGSFSYSQASSSSGSWGGKK